MICPNCKSEYQEGYTMCKDCNCNLIDMPDKTEKEILEKMSRKTSESIIITLVFGAVFIIGMIVLMNSIYLGDIKMIKIMRAYGGSMDTSQYLIYKEQSITNYRTIGGVLSLLGGLGVISNIKKARCNSK